MSARNYLTVGGKKLLQAEFDELWHRRRPAVVRALHDAAAEGDRSENAEYIYRKKELREIDRRVRYLGKRLGDAVVVSQPPADRSRVFFGARVSVTDFDGNTHLWRIVGTDEADAGKGWISIISPMAGALLKRSQGDELEVDLPAGRQGFQIETIEYRQEDYE